MLRLFRRHHDEEFDEEDDEVNAGDALAAEQYELPEFTVIVAESAIDGWHMAAVVGEAGNPEFYLRAFTVSWPFVIARPVPSNRASDKPARPEERSPTGSMPARKLVVNWGWEKVEGNISQLRFYVKRAAPALFSAGRVTVRLTLKESALPRRRIVLKPRSNSVIWNPPTFEDDEIPEEPTEPST